MKRGHLVVSLVFILLLLPSISAACILNAQLINQDPYPASPGQSVKVVFQINGVSNPQCKNLVVKLPEKYPFTLDPGQTGEYVIGSGIYKEDFSQFFLATYNLRVDENALDGNQSIELLYSYLSGDQAVFLSQKFNISIQDVVSDFEVHVDSYSFDTDKLSLILLNVGKNDADAVSVDLLNQEGVQVIGSKRDIVGKISSSQDDVASFDVVLSDVDKIMIRISYTDKAGARRFVDKEVEFDETPFKLVAGSEKSGGLGSGTSFFIGLLIPIIGYGIYYYYKKKKMKNKKHHVHQMLKDK